MDSESSIGRRPRRAARALYADTMKEKVSARVPSKSQSTKAWRMLFSARMIVTEGTTSPRRKTSAHSTPSLALRASQQKVRVLSIFAGIKANARRYKKSSIRAAKFTRLGMQGDFREISCNLHSTVVGSPPRGS